MFDPLFCYKAEHKDRVTKTIVFKVSPEIRAYLISNKIRISMKLCNVYDRVHVRQCSNCGNFGHTKSSCRAEALCTYCCEHHLSSKCTVKSQPSNMYALTASTAKSQISKIIVTATVLFRLNAHYTKTNIKRLSKKLIGKNYHLIIPNWNDQSGLL